MKFFSMERVSSLSPFGTRTLDNERDVFSENAWDNVKWDNTNEQYAKERIEAQAKCPVPVQKAEKFNSDPALFWDAFYSNHANKFFKNRNWLKHEVKLIISDSNSFQNYLMLK